MFEFDSFQDWFKEHEKRMQKVNLEAEIALLIDNMSCPSQSYLNLGDVFKYLNGYSNEYLN